ncbi:MAG: hypothetical protein HC915_13325, partial [Anaerolineae bacterium]|nr:hypothetical protein [Anaerolineae bacterium]
PAPTPDSLLAAETPTPSAEAPRLAVPLAEEPGLPVAEEPIGECADAALATIEDLAGVDERIYARVTCEGSSGWLPAEMLYGPVQLPAGDELLLGERAVIGFNQRGIYLSVQIVDIQGPSGGADVIAGECAYDSLSGEPASATVEGVGYTRDSRGAVVDVFYRVSCAAPSGEVVSGWISQRRAAGG